MELYVIQANLDDMSPELCSYVLDRLFEQGANDVYWIPIVMKKGRPGLMLNALVSQERLELVRSTIFKETTTLGLRYCPTTCHRLARKHVAINTPWGEVAVKVGLQNGEVMQYAPEYAACESIARRYQIPLKEVYDTIRHHYLLQQRGDNEQ